MKTKLIIPSIFLLSLSACTALPTHEHVAGDVITVNGENAVTCLEGKKFHEGQTLQVFETDCQRVQFQKRWIKVPKIECIEKKVGDAVIVSLRDPHVAQIKIISNAKIKTGDFIKP